jgi:glucan 1,3-beta-glucosidase
MLRQSLPIICLIVASSCGATFTNPTNNSTIEYVNSIVIPGSFGNHIQWAIRHGEIPSRGVNLGGWLVAERWMTKEAEIWHGLSEEDANSGEYTAMTKIKPHELAVERFQNHRKTFITEADIKAIAKAGINTVRVPVGYWIVGFDKHDTSKKEEWKQYAPGGLEYLDRLIKVWAWKHNVAVLISMHAAKGSQNGQDHSSPTVKGTSYWWGFPENVQTTLDAVKFLANRYKNDDAFLGIGLLNEPGGTAKNEILYKYYEDAYRAIRMDDHNECILTVAPLLWEQSPKFMVNFMKGPEYWNVWVEWHRYFVWGLENKSEEELLTSSMDEFQDDLNAWQGNPMFVGEWSFATAGKFGNDEKGFRTFAQKQLKVLNTIKKGWSFWSWRIYGDEEGVNPWSLRNMIRNGVVKLTTTDTL